MHVIRYANAEYVLQNDIYVTHYYDNFFVYTYDFVASYSYIR